MSEQADREPTRDEYRKLGVKLGFIEQTDRRNGTACDPWRDIKSRWGQGGISLITDNDAAWLITDRMRADRREAGSREVMTPADEVVITPSTEPVTGSASPSATNELLKRYCNRCSDLEFKCRLFRFWMLGSRHKGGPALTWEEMELFERETKFFSTHANTKLKGSHEPCEHFKI